MRKAIQDFEQDYKIFFNEGESKPQSVGRPFLIKGRSKAIGVVLLHGYMAAPLEVKNLATYLGRKGYWVYVPRLKGHGTSPEDLAQVTYQDWVNSVDEGYAIIANICRRVVAGGFSTGAALALDLSARVKQVAGVFAVSTPLRLQYFSSHFAPAMDMWNRLMEKVRLEEAKKEFVENNPENPHINYLRNPVAGVRELERLMDVVEPELSGINVPALVVQSAEDPVVDPRGSERIFKLIGSQDKQYVLFNFDRHGILLGDGSERVHRAIADFMDNLR
jgi:esterase/lipase